MTDKNVKPHLTKYIIMVWLGLLVENFEHSDFTEQSISFIVGFYTYNCPTEIHFCTFELC